MISFGRYKEYNYRKIYHCISEPVIVTFHFPVLLFPGVVGEVLASDSFNVAVFQWRTLVCSGPVEGLQHLLIFCGSQM